mgnify:CR=1 FL=1
MASENKQILDKLDAIKSEIDYIKKHMADVDYVLTEDDIESLKEAEKDFKQRKTKRLN